MREGRNGQAGEKNQELGEWKWGKENWKGSHKNILCLEMSLYFIHYILI